MLGHERHKINSICILYLRLHIEVSLAKLLHLTKQHSYS